MRGLTLDEKRFGPGYRDRLLTHDNHAARRCAIEGCTDATYAVLTLYVDAHPSGTDWYSKLCRSLTIGAENDVGLCRGHSEDVVGMDDELMESPHLWEPGRENPFVMPGPMRFV